MVGRRTKQAIMRTAVHFPKAQKSLVESLFKFLHTLKKLKRKTWFGKMTAKQYYVFIFVLWC